MDVRTRILRATVRVYAEAGYRGATTRRIAQEADVNEVTIFRHFGSKDALMRQALSCAPDGGELGALPAEPADPEPELVEWCTTRFAELHRARSVIRKVMGEMEEHPEIARYVKHGPLGSHRALATYGDRLRERGLASADANTHAAAKMLMGTLFTEAMSRDVMPELFSGDVADAIRDYVRLYLRAIGAAVHVAANGTRAPRRSLQPRRPIAR